MGWTSYRASYYTRSHAVDRKRECEDLLNLEDYELVRSRMVGSTHYAALRDKASGKVFASVTLTKTEPTSYFNFWYKILSEFDGPVATSCPKEILDILSPTDSVIALNWRNECRREAERLTPGKLPVGTKIRILYCGKTMELVKEPPAYQFKRPWWYEPATGKYMPHTRIPDNYQII